MASADLFRPCHQKTAPSDAGNPEPDDSKTCKLILRWNALRTSGKRKPAEKTDSQADEENEIATQIQPRDARRCLRCRRCWHCPHSSVVLGLSSGHTGCRQALSYAKISQKVVVFKSSKG